MKTGDEIREVLKQFVSRYRYQYQAANALHINKVNLSEMVNGRLPITERTAKKLGYTTIRMYKRVSDG